VQSHLQIIDCFEARKIAFDHDLSIASCLLFDGAEACSKSTGQTSDPTIYCTLHLAQYRFKISLEPTMTLIAKLNVL
jgi:hypothetical protein